MRLIFVAKINDSILKINEEFTHFQMQYGFF